MYSREELSSARRRRVAVLMDVTSFCLITSKTRNVVTCAKVRIIVSMVANECHAKNEYLVLVHILVRTLIKLLRFFFSSFRVHVTRGKEYKNKLLIIQIIRHHFRYFYIVTNV